MIVELKKPKLKDGKDQLRSYCNATGAPIAVWTNGDQISYYQRKDPNYFEDILGLPNANQTLADILQIKFTLEDLIANDKLRKEKKSLKALIEEMEDEVLANAGVDVFEELFKLIFTKLYDEWYSGQGNRRNKRSLEFRNTGQTEAALKNKIQNLFDSAKKKWEGVFSIEPEQNNYICSSGFAVLKPVKVEPEVLLVYLRLPVVCEILDLHTTASMYPAISTDDLLNIPITLPDESIRQKIAEKVRASRKAREQSKQLLEIAKTGVERAIETDETTATAWMNQQLEALGVKLSG